MEQEREHGSLSGARRLPWWQRRWLRVAAILVLAVAVGLGIAAEYILRHAEPILRKRIVETLSERFNAPVALDDVSISLLRGIEVNGYGLRIPFPPGTPLNAPQLGHAPPMVAVAHFAFRVGLLSLMHQPTRVAVVRVEGLDLHIPPPGERKSALDVKQGTLHADPENPRVKPKLALVVSRLQCRNVRLFIESGNPGKLPLEFDIASLAMQGVGKHQAMRYDAVLTNPKPRGLIHATGHFGPWANDVPGGEAGKTPLDGSYSFDHADLNTIKGIGGMLSATGHFAGVLDRIVTDGETDVPDFSLDTSHRPMPLHTRFHAIVDGTSGDTYLEPVVAQLAGSDFTTNGKVVKAKGGGHDIELAVNIPHGRMQDFLQLAVKTTPPLMNGDLAMTATLHIPPGDVRVPMKIGMAGSFQLTGVRFNNAKLQDRIDGLSARAQGKPHEVAEVSRDREAEVHSRMAARFTMGHGVLEVADVRYDIPGATVLLNGVYSVDGKLFDFKGHVRTDATASQMTTGWKSWLLKPVDPFLHKNGAGVELPIEISGTEGEVHMGLALDGADETPRQLLDDIHQKAQEKQAHTTAQHEAAAADANDAAAARAPTLEAAQRAHDAAVRQRAEALARLQHRPVPNGSPVGTGAAPNPGR